MNETEDREALMNSASTATIAPPVDSAEESGFSWWKLFTGQLFIRSVALDKAERAAEVTEDGDQGAVDPDVLEHEDGAGQAGPDVPGPDLDLSDTTESALADEVPPLLDLEIADQNELAPLEDEAVEPGLDENEPTAAVDPQLGLDVELETAVDDLGVTDSVVDQPDTAVALDTAGPAVALMEVDEPELASDISPSQPPRERELPPPSDEKDAKAEAWIGELRSGNHQQVYGEWEKRSFFGGHQECGNQVGMNALGLTLSEMRETFGDKVVDGVLLRNDHQRKPFKDIADFVEENTLSETRKRELEEYGMER
jgi:hypothetical protein